jgi:molybdate transport system substrate-binding protein
MKKLPISVCLAFLTAGLLATGCRKPQGTAPVSTASTESGSSLSGEMEVYVPCGVAGPYGAIQELFQKRYPDVKIHFDLANIDVQTKKVLNGKGKPDVWISLGDREVQAVAAKGLVDGEPLTYAYNSVGMIVERQNPCGIEDIRNVTSPKVKTIAVPSESNSSGYYARLAFEKAGVWNDIQSRLWVTDQPAMVKEQLKAGRAQVGIVYYPCTRETSKVGGEQQHVQGKVQVLGKIPTDLSGPIPAQAAVIKGCANPEAGRAFLKFLLEDPCQDIWEEWAFDRAVEPKTGARTTLYVYCGAGIRPFMDPVVEEYKKAHPEIRLDVGYAGSGCLLSQLSFARRGDLYLPGEDYYLNQAKERGFLTDQKLVAYLEPVLIVQKGNPKRIEQLADLARKGLKVGVGEPEACAAGRAAEAMLKQAKVFDKVSPNIVLRAGNVPELGNQVKLKALDAAIVWNVTATQVADSCDEIKIPKALYEPSPVPVGILKFTQHEAQARAFLGFCASPKGQDLVKAAGMVPAEGGPPA